MITIENVLLLKLNNKLTTEIEWYLFIQNNRIKEEVFEYFYDEVKPYINEIICRQNLSEKFLEKHFNDFNQSALNYLCIYQKLTENFILHHSLYISNSTLVNVFMNQNISYDFFCNYWNYLNEMNKFLSLQRESKNKILLNNFNKTYLQSKKKMI